MATSNSKNGLNYRIWAFGRKMVKYLNVRKTDQDNAQLRGFLMNMTCPIMTLYDEYFSQSWLQLLHFQQNHQKSRFCLTFEGGCRRQF